MGEKGVVDVRDSRLFRNFLVRMSTRSAEEPPEEDVQAEPANSSSSNQNSKPDEIAHRGEDGEDKGVEVNAPIHDASSAAHRDPAASQAQTKADLAKAAQTLRQDATEGEV